MVEVDVITQQVIRARMDGIVRELQASVVRTGFSTIIRESHDFSAAIMDRWGRTIGQYSPFPAHLGIYPDCVEGLLKYYDYADMNEGDCFLISHPYLSGCPHPNDMVVLTPLIYADDVVAFCSSMGHKSDIGGQTPGSRNVSVRDIYGEGLNIIPVRYHRQRKRVKETVQFLRSNSRTPELVLGDLEAQAGALWSVGVQRTKSLLDTYGKDVVLEAFEMMGQSTALRVRGAVTSWKDGAFEAETFVDDLAKPGEVIRLHVAAIKEGDRLIMDFSGCGDQSLGPINVRPSFVRGLVHYAVVSMIDPDIPHDFGLPEAIECRFREGSILDPAFPGPTGFYSSTVSIVEGAVFDALAQLSGRPMRGHNGSQGLVVMGNVGGQARRYVQFEGVMGGGGAHWGGDGYAGTGHAWSGGFRYTSAEIIESEFDVEMEQFRLVPDSGGAGRWRGGLSLRRDYRVLTDTSFAGGSGRVQSIAKGAVGGANGRQGRVVLNPGTDNEQEHKGLVSNLLLKPGEVVRVEIGSGGGVGDPRERDRDRLISDLRNGYVSPESAVDVYGMAPTEVELALASDLAAE